jgi:cell pole-organizing protein PopZ
MELTEKNGHSSIEEILASVRRIIAEEPGSAGPMIDLNASAHHPRGDGLLDDPSDFDLPSIFKSQSAPAADKPAPLFGRLSDAIRGASATSSDMTEPTLSSLKLHRADPADMGSSHHFLLSAFHETTAPRPDEIAASAMSEAPSSAAAIAVASYAPGPSAPTTTAPLLASQSPTPPAAVGDPTPSAPQVPRQMAAFKDTRFRSMGSAPVMPAPDQPVISPFEEAATAALVHAVAAPAEACFEPLPDVAAIAELTVEDLAAEAPATLTAAIVASYPALSPEPRAAEIVVAHVPPPVPLPVASPQAPPQQEAAAPIEDSTADLLRPMLRQWLAENMPRMVEKALHIEVAESGKSTKK